MRNMRQWVAWAERKIADVVVGEGLHVGLVGVVQGPQVVTFRLRLLKPDPKSLRRLLGLDRAVAQALQLDNVRVTDTARGILVEVPSPQPRTPSATLLAKHSQGLTVALGLDQWKKPVAVDLASYPTIAFIGPPGRGKSQAMKSTLFSLAGRNPPRRLVYAVFSQKRGDWEAFAPAAGCMAVVSDPQEASDALAWAAGELLQSRARDSSKWPAILFVVDDLINLLQRSPEVAGPLAELASMGRGLNVFLLLGTQQAGSKSGMGSTIVEDNLTCRVVYRASSATAGARSAGAGGLGVDQLTGRKGDALLVVDDRVERIATGLADDRLIVQLPAGDWGATPWRRLAIERGRTVRTGQNGQNGAVLSPTDDAHVGDGEGGTIERATERPAPFLPGNRPPTLSERQQLCELYRRLGSKEKVYFAAWGFKNGKVADWLRQALEEEDDDQIREETPTQPRQYPYRIAQVSAQEGS